MFKKIKQHFAKKKEKKRLRKYIQHEVIETLAYICEYIYIDGRRMHNEAARSMYNRYLTLKEFADLLRAEIIATEEKRLKK